MAPLYAWADSGGLLGIALAFLLTSIACKYGFVLLDRAANGEREPPALDLDMLTPTDQRAAIPMLGTALAAWSWMGWGGLAGKALAIALLALLPAIMGLVAVDGWRIEAFLPRPLLRAITALGAHYLLLLLWLGAVALLAALAVGDGIRGVWLYALALYLLWGAFALVGMAFYERRFELGYEPGHSPERQAQRAAQERARVRGRFIDELYVAARMRKHGAGRALLASRLARVPQDCLVEECESLYAAAQGWQLPQVLAWVAEALLATLLAHGHPEAALALVTRLLHAQPAFRFEAAGPRETLLQLALQSGRKELAAKLTALA